MSHFLVTPPASRLRLVPQAPMPGESLSSLFDRQAQLWGVSRRDLMYQTASTSGLIAKRDMDVCKGDFLDIYAEKAGINRQTLENHRADESYPLMFPRLRSAYCPMCFEQDASAGCTPYFRLDWARIFLTHCQRHSCPLFRWPHVSTEGMRKLPHGWFMGEGSNQRGLLQFRQDLMLAKAYARGVRPKKPNSIEAWNTLVHFETWMYQLGIGAPIRLAYDDRRSSIERNVMDQTVALARSETSNGRLLIDESKAISFEDQRVMSFAFKVFTDRCNGVRIVRSRTPRQVILSSEIQSMACRRAMLCMIACSFRCTED